jgi:hypothetical protein
MQNLQILKPLFAQVGLTFGVLMWLMLVRQMATMRGLVKLTDFETSSGEGEPAWILQARRHHSNLFEWPVIFYVVCLLIVLTGYTDELMQRMAWGYVACRTFHALVHLTFNHVMTRFSFFMASQVLLIGMSWRLAENLF